MHGDSNGIAFTGAEVCALGLCYQYSGAVFAWTCSLPDARAYFGVRVYFILRLHEGSMPWFNRNMFITQLEIIVIQQAVS